MSTVQEDESIVMKDIESLYLGNLATVEFDLHLPRKGKYGSKITWTSGDSRFLHNDGMVTRPKYGIGKRTVPLRASFQYGGCVKEKVYEVTILEEENNIQVSRIYPTRLKAELGRTFYLPAVAVVETVEGGVISHAVDWELGEERFFEEPGSFMIKGVLKDTTIPVTAEVLVAAKLDREMIDTAPAASSFPAGAVILKDGTAIKAAQDRSLAFLKKVNDDQMLYNFRAAADLDTRGAPEMTGWDSPDCLLRGHTTGHYLSALALCYAATGDEDIKRKAEYVVASLEECQLAFASKPEYHAGFLSGYSEEQFDLLEKFTRYPEIWAPYYTLHKIFAGLLDCYRHLGNSTALAIADKLGDWVYRRLSRLPNRVLKKMWGMYIAGEFGGINESLAELYTVTHKPEHLAAAKLFDNDRLFVPMRAEIDAIGGLHANQHIPQVIGALKIFQATGEKEYYDMARFFWQAVTEAHTYSIGGTGEGEMFRQPGRIGEYLSDKTAETCASYNMLKLTKDLFAYHPAAEYMDYYERAMFNHILASCDHQPTGGSTYFMPLVPGGEKSFDVSGNTCCHGTGLENHMKYSEAVYFYDESTVYVNLFVASALHWKEREVRLTMDVDGHIPGNVTLRVEGTGDFVLKVRRPYWSGPGSRMEINGRQADMAANSAGYVSISRNWQSGDEIQLFFDCRIRLEAAPDRKERVSLAYGPYILAALSEAKNYLRLPLREESLQESFVKETGPHGFAFRYIEDDLLFIPLADVFHERYHVYVERV
ncbi:beta-L-arabinofuranosidase domain-containing protein [Paenibacillus sp. NPDC093718]|uniref:beta-L-arabinofuranosidase domain-containing protein n=1 Tax=Paenibacillus sp. NPDC093718 TaxID=3390601 RepID=UPI003CFD2558